MSVVREPAVTTFFLAAEYAKVLRCSPEYVQKLLRQTPPAGRKFPRRLTKRGEWIITGKAANAWEIGSLPSPLIQRLAKTAQKVGRSSPLELVLNPPRVQVTRLTR